MDPGAGSSLELQAVFTLRRLAIRLGFIFPFSHILVLPPSFPYLPAVYTR